MKKRKHLPFSHERKLIERKNSIFVFISLLELRTFTVALFPLHNRETRNPLASVKPTPTFFCFCSKCGVVPSLLPSPNAYEIVE